MKPVGFESFYKIGQVTLFERKEISQMFCYLQFYYSDNQLFTTTLIAHSSFNLSFISLKPIYPKWLSPFLLIVHQ